MKLFGSIKSKIKGTLGRIRALFYVGDRQIERCCIPPAVDECDTSIGSAHREAVLSMRRMGNYFPKLYQIALNLRTFIRSVAYSSRYLFVVCLIAFAFWAFNCDPGGLMAMALVASVVMLATRDFLPALLPVVLLGFSIPMQSSSVGDIIMANLALFIPMALLLIGSIAYVISARPFEKGAHFWPYAAMSFSFIVAGIGFSEYNPNTILNLASVALSFVFYICARNGIRSVNKDYVVKVFTAIGILVFVEIVWFYLMCGDILLALSIKTLHLRWAISNAAAATVMITVPVTLYGYISTKKLGYIGAILIEYLAILLSLSRGCMLIAVVFLPVVVALIFINSDKKKLLALWGMLGVAAVTALMLVVEEVVSGTLERLSSLGFSDSGRFHIYKVAFNDFLSNPIFGVGVRNPQDPFGSIYWYHNTPLQFLACGGLIGIVAYLFHLISMSKRLLKGLFKPFNLCIAFAVVHWGLYGYIDNNFFMSVQAFLFATLLIMHEKNVTEEGGGNAVNDGQSDEKSEENSVQC